METISIVKKDCQSRQFGSLTIITSTITFSAIAIILLFSSYFATLSAQTPMHPVTIEGKMYLYLVTDYGEKMQEVDRYRKTGEGSMIAIILKNDERIDMTQYLDKEDVEALKDYAGTTLQSEFMVVPDWEVFESFSNEVFAAQFANKRVRVTGSFFYPDGGWRNVTPVRMDFTNVEVVE